MFGRKRKTDHKELTLVGTNSTINGDVAFSGHCHVDGTVNGSVTADPASSSLLTVVGDGMIDGSVSVPYVELNGLVRGDVEASERVKLGPTARVIGNVYYNLIEMAIGAEINGKLVHQPVGQVPLIDPEDTIVDSPIKPVKSIATT